VNEAHVMCKTHNMIVEVLLYLFLLFTMVNRARVTLRIVQ